MAKGDFEAVNLLIEQLEKRGLVVKSDEKGDCEPIVYSKDGRRIAHIGIREGIWFSIGRSGRDKGIYQKVSDVATLKAEVEAIVKISMEKVNKSKSKSTKSNKSNDINTSLEALKLRIQRLSPKSNAVHVRTITGDIEKYCQGEDYEIIENDNGYKIIVRPLGS